MSRVCLAGAGGYELSTYVLLVAMSWVCLAGGYVLTAEYVLLVAMSFVWLAVVCSQINLLVIHFDPV